MSTKKKGRKLRSDLENLYPMFQKAYAEDAYLDVSKLNADGTGSRKYELCHTSCRDNMRTKKHIPELRIVSNNYQSYNLATKILSKHPNYSNIGAFAKAFSELYGTGIIQSPKKSPKGVKSPKYGNVPVVGLPNLSGQTGRNMLKSPRTKSTSVSVASTPAFSVFGNRPISSPLRQLSPKLSPTRLSGSPQLLSRPQTPSQSPMRTSGSPLLSPGSPLLSPGSQSSKIRDLLRENNKLQY
jgi:hypothetical protein